MILRSIIVLLSAVAIVACSGPKAADASRPESTGAHAVSIDTLLRRFQAGWARPDSLTGTSPTREALARHYLDAVAGFDTSALRAMHITRAEYAHLYFPSSKMMRPPYELPPDAAWLLHTAESNKGVSSVMRRFGGQRFELESVRCPGEPLREGLNIVWRECLVRYHGEAGGTRERGFFAAIIEREGRLKFFSYASAL